MDRAADAVAARDAVTLRYCQLTEATRQLQANVKALHDNKCIFFSYCWREVCFPMLHQCSFADLLFRKPITSFPVSLERPGKEVSPLDRPLSYSQQPCLLSV